MNNLLSLPIILPLAAGMALVVFQKNIRLQRSQFACIIAGSIYLIHINESD